VINLILSASKNAVEGVEILNRKATETSPEFLAVNLVVDCAGRGSRIPAWLKKAGYVAGSSQ
jgi:hypothetical protein